MTNLSQDLSLRTNCPSGQTVPQDKLSLWKNMSLRTKTCPTGQIFTVFFCFFSTTRDGFSLQNLMRKLSSLENGSSMPMLLVLSDLKNNVFGAYFSFVPTVSENFQGKFSKFYVKSVLTFFFNFCR